MDTLRWIDWDYGRKFLRFVATEKRKEMVMN